MCVPDISICISTNDLLHTCCMHAYVYTRDAMHGPVCVRFFRHVSLMNVVRTAVLRCVIELAFSRTSL